MEHFELLSSKIFKKYFLQTLLSALILNNRLSEVEAFLC